MICTARRFINKNRSTTRTSDRDWQRQPRWLCPLQLTKVRVAVGRDCCAASQHQRLAFQIHMLAADELRVSEQPGSLPNPGEQHVPPGAFCLFPSMFPPVLPFQGPRIKKPSSFATSSAPCSTTVKSESVLSPTLAFTNCISSQVTSIPHLCPTPSHLACPTITCTLSPIPLP